MTANGTEATRRRISIRLEEELAKDTATLADLLGVSLNQVVAEALDEYVSSRMKEADVRAEAERRVKALRAVAKRHRSADQ